MNPSSLISEAFLFRLRVFLSLLLMLVVSLACSARKDFSPGLPDEYSYQTDAPGLAIDLRFSKGASHNHPLMAVWLEDMSGRFIQTLYVSESIGKGVFGHGKNTGGTWMPGEIRRPAALPYWAHQRNIQAEDGLYIPSPKHPVPDAYTGPTPPSDFIMHFRTDSLPPAQFRVLLEINQSWDWNHFWNNNKFPDDPEYKTSCQPALVYGADIDPGSGKKEYFMKALGHSHYSGKTGELFPDLQSLSTALDIAREIKLTIYP